MILRGRESFRSDAAILKVSNAVVTLSHWVFGVAKPT